jgi:hypothetical protein
LLVPAPVSGVTPTGTYPKYAPADVPCRRTQIRRNLAELFFSDSLISRKPLTPIANDVRKILSLPLDSCNPLFSGGPHENTRH